MRALLLVALAIAVAGCAKPIGGWSVEGADIAIHYNRNSESRTDVTSSIDWPPTDFRASQSLSQNAGGAVLTLRLRYEPKRKRAPSSSPRPVSADRRTRHADADPGR